MSVNNRFLKSLHLKNFLSYGTDSSKVELNPLNVLIGPNGSGKSNFIEAISFLVASAADLTIPIRTGGGVQEWLWKGETKSSGAEVEAIINSPLMHSMPLRHKLKFEAVNTRFELTDEVIENEYPNDPNADDVYFYYRYQKGHPVLNMQTPDANGSNGKGSRNEKRLRREDLSPEQSVISQRRDPDLYPEITYLGNTYPWVKIYRNWDLGRNTPARRPQSVDAPNDFLKEDASNLGLVLNTFERNREVKDKIDGLMRDFYEPYHSISTLVEGGTIQVFLNEATFNRPVPATRLSDGTLRYLSLLAVLCHPDPPPLICIEEPELGLHPDIIKTVADLLIDASRHTQLIITTHSDILIDALSDTPEAVIVCDKEDGATQMRNLGGENLKEWLDEYTLGNLWRSGEIGGNRW